MCSDGTVTEYSATCRHTLVVGDMQVSCQSAQVHPCEIKVAPRIITRIVFIRP